MGVWFLCRWNISIIEIVHVHVRITLDLKIQKIQSCEHIQVPGDSDKHGPIVHVFTCGIPPTLLKLNFCDS